MFAMIEIKKRRVFTMAVGASIGARVEHLRARKGINDSELAKVFGINRSTMSRILKGETEKVYSQMIIDTAQYFGVSTDFLLGLTDMPDPMNHPVESFGLTEGAAKAILSEDVNMEDILITYRGEDGGTGTIQ